jgi:serine/threonine protein phosphatase PrpC
MEDSHICNAKLTDDVAVFGVFDGHGGYYLLFFINILSNILKFYLIHKIGKEVAKFVREHFCSELLKNKYF